MTDTLSYTLYFRCSGLKDAMVTRREDSILLFLKLLSKFPLYILFSWGGGAHFSTDLRLVQVINAVNI